MFLRRPSSQTNLLSLPQRTLVTDELTQSLTKTVHQRLTYPVFQSQCTFVRDELISLVFHKGPSSQMNLVSLSQRTFVTDELSQSFTKDLRHRLNYSFRFHKQPSSQTNLLCIPQTTLTNLLSLSQTTFVSVFHKGPV